MNDLLDAAAHFSFHRSSTSALFFSLLNLPLLLLEGIQFYCEVTERFNTKDRPKALTLGQLGRICPEERPNKYKFCSGDLRIYAVNSPQASSAIHHCDQQLALQPFLVVNFTKNLTVEVKKAAAVCFLLIVCLRSKVTG